MSLQCNKGPTCPKCLASPFRVESPGDSWRVAPNDESVLPTNHEHCYCIRKGQLGLVTYFQCCMCLAYQNRLNLTS